MELLRALAVLAEPPTVKTAPLAELLEFAEPPTPEEYTELFIFQLYPYASVYLGPEGMMGGEARDRIGGFWRALGQTPPAEPDHLSVMLALYAQLAELEENESSKTGRAGWRNARRAFLWEHLLSWLPAYLTKLLEVAPPSYASWGTLLLKALIEEAAAVGVQSQLPSHLREAPGLIDPRSVGADDFLGSVLAPVRSGVIITRSDLAGAARRLGLGLRRGERKFILKALMAQDAPAVFGWLVEETQTWLRHHQGIREGMLEAIAGAWAEKAQAAATLLEELKLSASKVV